MRCYRLAILYMLLPQPEFTESPQVFIFDVLHRPDYRAGYEKMLRGARDLPDWMASPDEMLHSTANAVELFHMGTKDYEVYTACKPHDCELNRTIVLFTDFGETAKAALTRDGRKRFLGHPDRLETKLLATD